MKKLNLGNINAGLSTIKELANENAGIARDELIDVSLIDFANKNTYAANDTDDSIRDLADQIGNRRFAESSRRDPVRQSLQAVFR